MKIIAAEKVTMTQPGDWYLCIIANESELDTFAFTGADVEGMGDDDLIAPGSIVITPTANYIAFEGGIFTQSQISGGGGGGGGGVAGVSTWNGRSGNVYPRSGDYNAAKVTTSTPGVSVQDVIDNLSSMITYDGALSPTSEKAVMNKVVAEAISQLEGKVLPAGGTSGQILAKASNTNYNAEWISGNNFMLKSVYDTDDNGRVDKADTAYALQGPTYYKAQLKNTYSDTYVLTEQDKAARNGVAPLDENRKILPEFLPDNIMAGLTYGGIFNATTRVVRLTPAAKSILGVSSDTMTLQNSSTVPEGYPANAELFYITTVSDEFAGMTFDVGDWLISLGTEWQQLKNGSQVSSVNTKTGAVVLTSDDINEGLNNLYMTTAERNKLSNIEGEATKDVNVIQTAQITTLADGTRVLRLTNKNGTVTDFEGSGGLDADEYLKKTGNSSQTFVMYTPGSSRQTFTGNEALALFHAKVVAWLNAIEAVAFTGRYDDLTNTPTKLSEFTNDGNGNTAYPFIDSRVNNLSNYYTKTQTYTKAEVDALIDAIEGMNFIQVAALPTTNIDDRAIYYVPRDGGGYDRYQHMNNQWLYLGSTDVSMEGYLTTAGNASNVTTTFTMADARVEPESGETLATTIGKLQRWVHDLAQICFTASWHDLVDASELATQEDLEEYLQKKYSVNDEGKVPVVDETGTLALKDLPTGAMRKGEGANSMIGNDSVDSPVNMADGSGATALGTGTQASGSNQLVYGRYNVADSTGDFAEIIGGGNSAESANIKTTDWSGNGWYKGRVSVGNNSDNIVSPVNGNDLTPKNYVDSVVDTKIAQANLLKSMIVSDVPEVEDADANTLYLIADPTSEDTYITWKKVLVQQNPDVYMMAKVGSTQVSTSGTQVTALPAASAAYAGTVYEYIGTGSEYKFGFNYACVSQGYYAWLNTSNAEYYYTTSSAPLQYAKIYSSPLETAAISETVASVAGTTLTDSAGQTYTRLSAQDTAVYEWHIINSKLSEFENDGTGTGAPNDKYITKQDLIDIVYPVGSIYMSLNNVSPATLFGGTWTRISGRMLRGAGSSDTAGSTGGSDKVTIARSNLPNVSIATSSNGSYTKNLDGVRGFTYKSGGESNKWGIDYGKKELYEKSVYGSSETTAANHTHSFNLNGDVTQTELTVQNPYILVHMWRRTA